MNAISNLIQDANLIVDCDEILVNIAPLWAKKIAENKEIFKDYLKTEEIEEVMHDYLKLANLVCRRPTYYLTDWLKKDGVEEIPKEIIDKVMELYNDDEEFYHKLPLNKMAVGLRTLSYHPSVKKVYVVTRCTTDTNYPGKEALIKSLFPETKLEIRRVNSTGKKSDAIKDIDIKNGFIFEDEIKNIRDYLENSDISECNIYVPKLGYNIPTFELIEMAEKKNVAVSYY